MADAALASALSALGLGDDALATLRALPDPLVLKILERLEAPDLTRRARVLLCAAARGGCACAEVSHAASPWLAQARASRRRPAAQPGGLRGAVGAAVREALGRVLQRGGVLAHLFCALLSLPRR
jgi:hypothetical protein